MKAVQTHDLSTTLTRKDVESIDKILSKNRRTPSTKRVPRTRAGYLRAAVRFAIENPRAFNEWMENKWAKHDDKAWARFVEETSDNG